MVSVAAYIGGVGYFIGPVIGAVIVTFLQFMLSDVTEIWQLYFGLLFIVIVMFAPNGIAGLLMMQQPLWRAGVLQRLIPAYLLALVPGLVMVLGAILSIEMIFRVSVKLSEGSQMTFMRVPLDVLRPASWLIAAAMVVGGFVLFRMTWRAVANAWHEAAIEARSRGQAI